MKLKENPKFWIVPEQGWRRSLPMGTLVLVTTRDSLTSCFDYAAESEGKSPHRDTGGGKKKNLTGVITLLYSIQNGAGGIFCLYSTLKYN